MKKFILTLLVSVLFTSSSFAWDGFSEEEEFLIPPDLVNYCQLEYSDVKGENGVEVLYNCLGTLESQRTEGASQEREDAASLSSVVATDYNVYSIAIAGSRKNFVGGFMVEVDEEQAKGEGDSEGSGDEEDDDAEIKTAIDKVVATSRDNAVVMNKFLQQYASVLASKSYKAFHSENILKAKITRELNTTNPYDNGGGQ